MRDRNLHLQFFGTLPTAMPVILPAVRVGAAFKTTRHKCPYFGLQFV